MRKKQTKKQALYLPTESNSTHFTIHGCGNFGESSKKLNKEEALFLVMLLLNWLKN